MDRLLAMVKDCRVVLPPLERGGPGESSSAEAERILYYTLMSAVEVGLIKTLEDAVKVLGHASQPLGPMGGSGWSARLERWRKGVRDPVPRSSNITPDDVC